MRSLIISVFLLQLPDCVTLMFSDFRSQKISPPLNELHFFFLWLLLKGIIISVFFAAVIRLPYSASCIFMFHPPQNVLITPQTTLFFSHR